MPEADFTVLTVTFYHSRPFCAADSTCLKSSCRKAECLSGHRLRGWHLDVGAYLERLCTCTCHRFACKRGKRPTSKPLKRHALSSSPVQLPHAEQQQHPLPAPSSPEGSPSTQLSTQYCMVQAEAYRCDSAASLKSGEYSHLQICTNLRFKGFSEKLWNPASTKNPVIVMCVTTKQSMTSRIRPKQTPGCTC